MGGLLSNAGKLLLTVPTCGLQNRLLQSSLHELQQQLHIAQQHISEKDSLIQQLQVRSPISSTAPGGPAEASSSEPWQTPSPSAMLAAQVCSPPCCLLMSGTRVMTSGYLLSGSSAGQACKQLA